MSVSGIDRIREAVGFVPADDRDVWLRMGMAIKSELGDAGFDVWDEWSQRSDSYDARAARDVWKSIRPNGAVTAGTLFRAAQRNGWRNRMTTEPTVDNVAGRNRAAGERATREEIEIAQERAETAAKAKAIWKAATAATPAHPYLSRKRVSPVVTLREIEANAALAILGYSPKSDGELLAGRLLVVLVKQGAGISTLELIDGDGRKAALAGRGTKVGGFWSAQPLPEGDGAGSILMVAEGVATGLSAREATGRPVIAALSSSNVPVVAKAVRERHPAAELVILADLVKSTGAPDPHAIAAALAVGGKLAVPEFGSDRPSWAKDFNDMAALVGAEAVKRAVEGARRPDDVPSTSQESGPSAPDPRAQARALKEQTSQSQAAGPTSLEQAPADARPWPDAMDDAAMHGIAGDFVRMVAPDSEADPAAILIQFLIAFGALVGRGPNYQVESDQHHSNLFTLLIGNTAKGRKGTSFGRVREIFEQVANWKPHVSGLSSGEGMKYHVRDAREETKRTKKGGTMEIVDEGVRDKRLLVVEAEFAGVLRAVQRQGNTLSATMRESWDTGNLRTLTKNDPITATGAHICIIGHITAEELRAELTATDTANGFANRFLFAAVRRSQLLPFGGNQADPIRIQGFADRLGKLAEQARRRCRMAMTENARTMWANVYPMLSADHGGLYGAVTARAEAQAVRLALVYALLDGSDQIDAPHLLAALAVWQYCDATARHIFGTSLGDRIADEILRALQRTGTAGLTRTDIRDLFDRNVAADRIGAALELLRSQGRATVERVQGSGGGRPPEVWKAAK